LTYKLANFVLPGYLPLTLAANSGAATQFSLHSTMYMIRQTFEFTLMYSGAVAICWLAGDRKATWRNWHLQSLSFSQYAASIYLLVLTLKLGHHTGQHIVYYVQFLAPFLLVTFAPSGKVQFREGEFVTWSVLTVAYCLTIIVTWRAITSPFRILKLVEEETVIYQDILPYRNVLAPSMLTSVSLAQGKTVYDPGQSRMLVEAANKQAWNMAGMPLTKKQIEAIDRAYRERVADMIAKEQFDLIVTEQNEWLTEKHMDLIRSHYKIARNRRIYRTDEVEWIPIRAALSLANRDSLSAQK
jgi:hypothetical protein